MATANGMAREAMGYLDGHINDWKQVLVDLCRIPSMSASGFPAEQVRRSAQAVAKALTDAGVGLYQKVAKPSAKQLARIRSLKFSEAKFKKDSGMLPGMALWGERKFSPLERMWTRPALTVIALEARQFQGSSNQIIEAARARLSLRTVPGMDPREAGRLLVKKLTTRPPFGARITAKVNGTTPWWTTDPEGPAFEAARRALRMGFGKDTAMIGAGGTIGFVQPFADLLRGAPCILMGVAEPNTHAHSENESLHLGDWVKAMRSTIHLYDELARVPVAKR